MNRRNKELKESKNKRVSLLKDIIIKAVVFFIIYAIGISLYSFVFTNKLSDAEYFRLRYFYISMKEVDREIKSDFYVDKLLRVIDRNYILKEFRRDSLVYSLLVTDTAFEMYMENRDVRLIRDYIDRCYLTFSEIVGASKAETLLQKARIFFRMSVNSDEELEDYNRYLEKEIIPLQEKITLQDRNSHIKQVCVVASYFVLVILLVVFREQVSKSIGKFKQIVNKDKIKDESK